jgi:hypothetical protein
MNRFGENWELGGVARIGRKDEGTDLILFA